MAMGGGEGGLKPSLYFALEALPGRRAVSPGRRSTFVFLQRADLASHVPTGSHGPSRALKKMFTEAPRRLQQP